MNDFEITRLCAEALGVQRIFRRINVGIANGKGQWFCDSEGNYWDPLRDNAQMMTLVKQFNLRIEPRKDAAGLVWWNVYPMENPAFACERRDLNHAACSCIAKAQKEKKT